VADLQRTRFGLIAIAAAAFVLAVGFAGWRVGRAMDDGRSVRDPQPGSEQAASDEGQSEGGKTVAEAERVRFANELPTSFDDLPEVPDIRRIAAAAEAINERLGHYINNNRQPDPDTFAGAEWLVEELDRLDEQAIASAGDDLNRSLAIAALAEAVAADVLRGKYVPLERTDPETLERAKRIMRAGLSHNRNHIRMMSVAVWRDGGVERYPEFVSKIRTMRETDPVDSVAFNANRVKLPGDDW